MSEGRKYLNSFYPLSSTRTGRKAVAKYQLPPYIDGSCRREPDFENDFPCITSLCRPGFAEKLKEGDIVIYATNKKGVGARKIVAELKVIKIFENHEEAGNWFRNKKTPIPNNLMVSETRPLDLDKTHQKMGWDEWVKSNNSLEQWNEEYIQRSKTKQKVAQCEIIYRNIDKPSKLDERKLVNRKLVAQNPPILSEEEYQIIKDIINNEQ